MRTETLKPIATLNTNMTGWTQATVRFEEAQHADALVEDVEASPHRASYNEAYEDIARVRLVGYDKHEDVLDLLQAAGPAELALVADFNDTTDSGGVEVYRPHYSTGWRQTQGGATCPEASRWSFELSVGGLTETGLRAGNDFTLEEQYGEDERAALTLDEMERISDEVLEQLKTAGHRPRAEEFDRNA